MDASYTFIELDVVMHLCVVDMRFTSTHSRDTADVRLWTLCCLVPDLGFWKDRQGLIRCFSPAVLVTEVHGASFP